MSPVMTGRLARWLFLLSLLFACNVGCARAEGELGGDAGAGREVFESLTCIECHRGGENQVRPSKPIKGAAFKHKYPHDAQIVKVIRNGVKNSSMPAFGPDMISEEEMKDLVTYIRSLSQASEAEKKPAKKQPKKAAKKQVNNSAGAKKKGG